MGASHCCYLWIPLVSLESSQSEASKSHSSPHDQRGHGRHEEENTYKKNKVGGVNTENWLGGEHVFFPKNLIDQNTCIFFGSMSMFSQYIYTYYNTCNCWDHHQHSCSSLYTTVSYMIIITYTYVYIYMYIYRYSHIIYIQAMNIYDIHTISLQYNCTSHILLYIIATYDTMYIYILYL